MTETTDHVRTNTVDRGTLYLNSPPSVWLGLTRSTTVDPAPFSLATASLCVRRCRGSPFTARISSPRFSCSATCTQDHNYSLSYIIEMRTRMILCRHLHTAPPTFRTCSSSLLDPTDDHGDAMFQAALYAEVKPALFAMETNRPCPSRAVHF